MKEGIIHGSEGSINCQALYTKAIRALTGRAEVYHIIGAPQKSKADYERVLMLSRDVGHKLSALIGLSILHYDLGDYDRELSCAYRLIRLTRKMDPLSRGKALTVKAGALRDKGKYELSLKTSQGAINLFRSARKKAKLYQTDPREIRENMSNAYKTMGMVYNLQGKYDPALTFFRKSLEFVKKNNDQIAITHMMNNIGLVYRQMARYDKARDHLNKGLAIAQKIGYKNGSSLILGNMGLIHSDQDEYHAALGCYQKAMAVNKELGNRSAMASNLNNAGLCHANLCDYRNALNYYTPSLDLFRQIDNKIGIAFTLSNIGMTLYDQGEYGKALTFANDAEKIASSIGILEIVNRCLILKAKIFRVYNKYATSIKLLERAIRSTKKYKMEGLRITAINRYLITAFEEKSKTHRADISRYSAELERAYQKATADNDKSNLLIVLIKYHIFKKDYDKAKSRFRLLSCIVKKMGDKYMTAETLLVHARFNKATGKEYADEIKKAKALAKELGVIFLLDEIKELE